MISTGRSTRKSAALLVAAGLLVALLGVALAVPLPYVVMSPGVTENTLGTFDGKDVITIKGQKTYPTSGQLDLTTVSVTSPDFKPRLFEILNAWVSSDQIVLPRDVIYPPDTTPDQVSKQNTAEMVGSQSTAIGVGLEQAGFDALKPTVGEVSADSPAEGELRKGDVITSVNGTDVGVADDAIAQITSLPPGSDVEVGVQRDGKDITVDLVTAADPDDAERSRIGISLADEFDPPFEVKIDLGQDIGGPSAGMMFSLAIYDMLTPGELTGGAHIAGTGTISTDGTVGKIGGVQQKIAGAHSSGATVFLVPAGDCGEAAGSSLVGDIDLIKVATIDEAISALDTIRAGDVSQLQRCGS